MKNFLQEGKYSVSVSYCEETWFNVILKPVIVTIPLLTSKGCYFGNYLYFTEFLLYHLFFGISAMHWNRWEICRILLPASLCTNWWFSRRCSIDFIWLSCYTTWYENSWAFPPISLPLSNVVQVTMCFYLFLLVQ